MIAIHHQKEQRNDAFRFFAQKKRYYLHLGCGTFHCEAVAGAWMESSSTAVAATSSSTALGAVQTNVPPGVRVKWFQRKETLSIEVEVPGIEDPEIFMTDEGLVELKAKDPKHTVTLQLLHRIHTEQSRRVT